MAGWFEVREFPDGVVGLGEPGHDEDVKSFLVRGSELALLFDTGTGIGDIRPVVDQLVSTPVLLVNSHAHWDHIGGNWQFPRIWIHEAEADRLGEQLPPERLRRFAAPERFIGPPPEGFDIERFTIRPSHAERRLREGDEIDLGDRRLRVMHTPGHSPGGITLVDEARGIALVGDAVYAGPLYAHISGSDPAVYRTTLSRLADLAPDLSVVYPSHNAYPLEPAFLRTVSQGYESIWEGRAPDARRDGIEEHRFERFGVLLPEGWRG
ncbi:MAG TPA: MBL fold metallo-hydrolase [Thermomicrobiaceae bacterium]|nr:MBL fold metallo-hydrolase [Thermomicrobiaceae bacterium]